MDFNSEILVSLASVEEFSTCFEIKSSWPTKLMFTPGLCMFGLILMVGNAKFWSDQKPTFKWQVSVLSIDLKYLCQRMQSFRQCILRKSHPYNSHAHTLQTNLFQNKNRSMQKLIRLRYISITITTIQTGCISFTSIPHLYAQNHYLKLKKIRQPTS